MKWTVKNICRLEFVIHMSRQFNHSFLVAGEKNMQHGSNPCVVAKKIREECREYFSLEEVVS